MAYEGPFSNRQISNLVYLQEQGLQLNGRVGVVDAEPIILDATTKFSRNTKAEVSDNPMADKSDRADHYRIYNSTFKFDGVISNDSINLYDWVAGAGESRAQQLVERLDSLFKDKKLVEVYMPDGLRTQNCLITSLNVSRDKNWSNGFYISIEAREIELITSEITAEPVTEDKDLLGGSKDGGEKAGTADEPQLKMDDVIVPPEATIKPS